MLLNLPAVFTLLCSFFAVFTGNNYSHITKKYSVHGIDVSHHQKYINWDNVANHGSFKVKFCFMKATEGSNFSDTRFKTNWRESKEAGIIRGAYHFFSMTSSPTTQAQHFIRTVALEDGDLAPVLDFETDSPHHSTALVRKNLQRWLYLVEKHYGVKPIIYTNTFIYKKYLSGYFKEYPLWIADYNTSNIHQNFKNPKLKIWQYTQSGRVSGINSHVDINAFLGQEEEFEHLIYRTEPLVYNIVEDIDPQP